MANKKTVSLVVLAIVLTNGGGALLFARIFLVRTSRVPTGSMKNTIIPGDHVLTFRLFGKPERGDVVIFQYPSGPLGRDAADAIYVGRIVGLPGERIQLIGRTIYINEQPLDEAKVLAREDKEHEPLTAISKGGTGPYQVFYMEDAAEEPPEEARYGTITPFLLPADNYFMLGDNRDNSMDSRYAGPVPRELIWGKVSLIYMSVSADTGEFRSDRAFKRIE